MNPHYVDMNLNTKELSWLTRTNLENVVCCFYYYRTVVIEFLCLSGVMACLSSSILSMFLLRF